MTTAAPLSSEQVRGLPAMPTAMQAFRALNIGKTAGYELIASGQFPIEIIRLGRAFRVRKADLLAFLGLQNDDSAGEATPTPSVEHVNESAQIGTRS